MRWLNRHSEPFPYLAEREERTASLADHRCPYRDTLEALIVTLGASPSRLWSQRDILAEIGAGQFAPQPGADPVTGCAPVTADGGQPGG